MQFLCKHEKHHETIEILFQLCRPTFTCQLCSKVNCLNLGIYNSHVRITTNADSRLQTDSLDRTLYKTSQLSPVSSYVPRESRPAGYQVEFVRYQSVFNFQCRFLLARSTETLAFISLYEPETVVNTMHIKLQCGQQWGRVAWKLHAWQICLASNRACAQVQKSHVRCLFLFVPVCTGIVRYEGVEEIWWNSKRRKPLSLNLAIFEVLWPLFCYWSVCERFSPLAGC